MLTSEVVTTPCRRDASLGLPHVECQRLVRQFFNSADYVPPYTVFDVGGNNYRVVVIVRYRFKKVFVQHVMTHRGYDDWNKLYRKGKA